MNIIQAAQQGSYSEVEAAIARHEPIDLADTAGFTALHWAAIRGHADIIELLVSKGAKINHPATRLNVTPLHMAAIANRKEAVEKLLSLGAEKEAKNAKGDTPLNVAIQLNGAADWIKIEAQDLPVVSIVNQLGNGFDAIFALLMHGATVAKKESLSQIAINAIIHDRADVLSVLFNHGFDYKTLNDEDSVKAGFDYAVILATSNFAINCLRLLLEKDPHILRPSLIGQLFNSNLFIWMIQQLPDREIFAAPFLFFEIQEERALRKHELDEHIPTCLKSCDVSYTFDQVKNRFYVSKVMYGLCALYFDQNGQLQNKDDTLRKLRETIALLLAHGIKLNHQDLTGDTPAKFLVRCPKELIQIFVDYGIKFSGEDLQRAIKTTTGETVEVLLEAGAPVDWKDSDGHDAMDVLMKADNDLILNDRPKLMKMIQDRVKPVVTLSDQFSALSLSTDYPHALTPQYDRLSFTQAVKDKESNQARNKHSMLL